MMPRQIGEKSIVYLTERELVEATTLDDPFTTYRLSNWANSTATPGNFLEGTELSRDDLRRHLNRGRTYVWPPNSPDQREYVSVTNALNAIPKDALPRWAAKVVAETAVEKLDLLNQLADDDPNEAVKWLKGAPWSARDRAADIGTSVHEIVELDALGRSDEADQIISNLPHDGRAKAAHARDFFRTAPVTVELVEFVVYDHQHGFAGTGDFIVTLGPELESKFHFPDPPHPDGARLVLDLKTGKGVYPEAAIQMAAYRHAGSMVDLRTGKMVPMPPTDGAAVLHVTEDGWGLIPVDSGREAFDIFLRALDLSGVTPLDRNHVGTPVMRGKATELKTPAELERERLWA